MRNMTVNGFIKGTKFWTIKANAPKRGCVTQLAGRLGTLGRKNVRGFAVKAEMREFVKARIERMTRAGWVQIA